MPLRQRSNGHCARTPGLPTPGHPEARSVARGDLQDCPLQDIPRLAAWPEEDGVIRASRWRGHVEEAIVEEEEEEVPTSLLYPHPPCPRQQAVVVVVNLV